MRSIELRIEELDELYPEDTPLALRAFVVPLPDVTEDAIAIGYSRSVGEINAGQLQPPRKELLVSILHKAGQERREREISVRRKDGVALQIARVTQDRAEPPLRTFTPVLARGVGKLSLWRSAAGIWVAREKEGELTVQHEEGFYRFWERLAEGALEEQRRLR